MPLINEFKILLKTIILLAVGKGRALRGKLHKVVPSCGLYAPFCAIEAIAHYSKIARGYSMPADAIAQAELRRW